MYEKVLIVGDLHGDWGRLNQLITKKRPDLVLQCGDFGWWPKMEVRSNVLYGQKSWKLHGLKPGSSIIRWCDGNHEDHEDLDSLGRQAKDSVWCYENVIYQPRGSVHTLKDGRRILFFGGAESVDRAMRTPGFDWFHREIPNYAEFDRAMDVDKVDIIISHTCPNGAFPKEYATASKANDPTTLMLRKIMDHHKPTHLFHGHWHSSSECVSGDTTVISLDYPGHGHRWWTWL